MTVLKKERIQKERISNFSLDFKVISVFLKKNWKRLKMSFYYIWKIRDNS